MVNPLEFSCLENPRDRGAWWAFVYGVAQSRTRLKRLSSKNICIRLFIATLCVVAKAAGKKNGVSINREMAT